MRVIKEFKSLSGRNDPHSVREDDWGNLFCTCPAWVQGERHCWAMKIVEGDRQHERMMQSIRDQIYGKIVLPKVEEIQRRAWAQIRARRGDCDLRTLRRSEINDILKEYACSSP